MSDFEKFRQAIYGQESNNGKVDTSQPNYAGARGKGQIIEPTFNGLKAQGKIPANYEWSNPAHNEAASDALMKDLWDKAGGRPDLAAAMYYGGEKAVRNGQIVSFGDKKNPKAPTTDQYAASIMQRMGEAPTLRQVDNRIEAGPTRSDLEAAVQASIMKPTEKADFDRMLQIENQQRLTVEEYRPSTLEQFGAAMASNIDNRLIRGITDRLFAPRFAPEEGFKPDLKVLPPNADTDLVRDYGTAKSKAEADHVLAQWNDEQFRVKTVMDDGVYKGVALSFAAEFGAVTNYIAPFAAAKALGRAASYSGAIAENVLSGTAIEAVAQGLEGKFRPMDLAISVVADGLIGAGSHALGIRHEAGLAAERMIAKAQAEAFDRDLAMVTKAEAKLGPRATVEEVRAEADRMYHEELKGTIEGALADVPAERKLLQPEPPKTGTGTGEDGYPNLEAAPIETVSGRLNREAPDTPEFKAWFKDSAATQDGKPVVVYHLTNADIEAFDKAKLGSNTGATSAKEGFFFAGDPATTQAYAKPLESGATPNVMPVYLSMQNPKVYDMQGSVDRKRTYAGLLREAKAEGRDGLIVKNTYDGGPQDTIYVVFDETQIKSAIGNSGAYDPTNPNVNKLEVVTKFQSTGNEARVGREMTRDDRFTEMADLGIFKRTNDYEDRVRQLAELKSTPGIHLAPAVANSPSFQKYANALELLRKQLIPDVAIHLTDGGTRLGGADGLQGIIKPGVSMIAVRPGIGMRAVIHEFGHAVFAHRFAQLPDAEKAAMIKAWREWQATLDVKGGSQESMLKRSPVAALKDANGNAIYKEPIEGSWKGNLREIFRYAFDNQQDTDQFVKYFSNFDEFAAEQFVKHVEAISLKETKSPLSVPMMVVNALKMIAQTALEVFGLAKSKGLIAANASFAKFFDDLVVGNKAKKLPPLDIDLSEGSDLNAMAVPAKPADVVNEVMTDPDTARFGMTTIPVATAADRAKAQAILALHKKAAAWEQANPMDAAWEKRMQNLAANNVFGGKVASIGLTMLRSKSPLVRMLASELLEDASGVAGKRQATAAISKYMTERLMLGNALNDVQDSYTYWKGGASANLKDDLIGGEKWAEFNKLIAAEIEARRATGSAVTTDANIKAAADSLEAAYQRIANEQRKVGTIGSEGLPKTSVGYMPHRMNPKAVFNMTSEQNVILHDALVDQFVTIEGWDMSFADMLASKYITRVRERAAGDFGSSIAGGSTSTASIVEEALRAMDLPEATIKNHMDKFQKGAANFTKGRIELDLNKVYQTSAGEFRLLDIFETNQLELLRSQAGRASGEVALTKFGVQGKPGLKLLRDAMQFGEDGKKAGMPENEAFDQMAAEFMNEPFGTATGKFMERAMMANTLVRLGGLGFNQFAEAINGIFHVGALRTMSSIASMPRLRKEVLALAKGQHVDNPILRSIELTGGAEFGTDAYKVVMPFDSPDHAFPTYGQDTLTATDRLLRGATHVQGMMSGWRAIHSAQQRGMAEQIVHKMAKYLRDGGDDVALEQMGINASMRQQLQANLPSVAKFDANGNLIEFDVTKIENPDLREQVIQAVHRGTSQIIQGTFIGERGKWAHDGLLKVMTQFRSFSLTSMEKQWGRQRNSRGAMQAFGLLMGSMSMAVPVYMARVLASAQGREDKEKYIDERMQPQHLARATLNYVAMSGLAGDFIDAASALAPEDWGVTPTGGRAGVESTFVGNYVAPSLSLVDDVWKAAQGADANEIAKLLPGSRLPYVLPLVNSTRE